MKLVSRLTLTAVALALLWTVGGASATDKMSDTSGTMTDNDMIFQSSELGDLDVFNQSDAKEKLGNLENLIVNAHTGQVLYGILDTGVGGQIIPVPWNSLRLHKTTSDKTVSYWLSLNKTSDDLAKAPTFDKNHWPDFTNSQWKQSVDNFFGVRVVAKPEESARQGELTTNEMIFQSSRLGDLNVFNRDDTEHKLGNLDNLIINAHTGQVLYGILDTGAGGKNIAVPWNAFLLKKAGDSDEYWLTLNKTTDELANAPTFDKDRMSDVTDSKWRQTVDNFFGVRTTARPER